MNKAPDLIEHLSSVQSPSVVILAPNAPPVLRTSAGLELMMKIVLDANDILDTFKGFHRYVQNQESIGDKRTGDFSFGIPGAGRFRVVHIAQRGTKLLRVSRVPSLIPELETVCPDALLAARMLNFIGSEQGGLLLVSSPSPLLSSSLVYALLSRINHGHRKIVYAVERYLTFLMHHEESIVIQSELGLDVASYCEGIGSALMLEPDILFVGDVRSNDDLGGLTDMLREGTQTILSGVMLHNMAIVERFLPDFKQGVGTSFNAPTLRLHIIPGRSGVPTVEVL